MTPPAPAYAAPSGAPGLPGGGLLLAQSGEGAGAAEAAAAAAPAAGYGHAAPELVSLLWTVPFAGLLLSIAIWPLAAPDFWHRHYGKITAFWAALALLPLGLFFGADQLVYLSAETLLHEYVPFVILLTTLFALSGGVRIHSRADGGPLGNLAFIGVGTFIAGFIGTTGASMLLIRPLLLANQWRRHRVHTVIFFIFLVSNIGGSLTPLGDPPLFLGFLNGVDFFWPTRHMALPMTMVALPLLVAYLVLDTVLYRRDKRPSEHKASEDKFRIEGSFNLVLLLVVLGAIIATGSWRDAPAFYPLDVKVGLDSLIREAVMLGCLAVSLVATRRGLRESNRFTWEPMIEVAKLFAGIFVALIPVGIILRSGEDGSLGFVLEAVSRDGEPIDLIYFWMTGFLSAFLDNAPTYLLFFNLAGGGDAEMMMGPLGSTLLAISTGAVFMGAYTYIGNAPNLMVRGVAREWKINMPSFFGYMAWASVFLLPPFLLMSLVFFL